MESIIPPLHLVFLIASSISPSSATTMSIVFGDSYSTGVRKVDTLRRPFGGRPQVKRGFYRRLEAFVIAGILDFCLALLFVSRLPDNNSRNNDNSHTVGY